jgi:hypothetical protein
MCFRGNGPRGNEIRGIDNTGKRTTYPILSFRKIRKKKSLKRVKKIQFLQKNASKIAKTNQKTILNFQSLACCKSKKKIEDLGFFFKIFKFFLHGITFRLKNHIQLRFSQKRKIID